MGQGLPQPGAGFISSTLQRLPRSRATVLPLQAEKLRLREEQPLTRHSAQNQVTGSFSCTPPPSHLQRPQQKRLRALRWLKSVQDLGTSAASRVSERHQRQGVSGPRIPDPGCPGWVWTWVSGDRGDNCRTWFPCHLSRMTSTAPHTHRTLAGLPSCPKGWGLAPRHPFLTLDSHQS